MIPRVVLSGAALAIIGIVLFAVLWSVLAGVDSFPRLILSMCVPPTIMAAIVGVYMLVVRPGSDD